MAESELVPVEVVALIEDEQSQSPIVVLYDRANDRILPIWIGDPEARAIAIVLNHISTPRPLTHDLFLSALKELGVDLTRMAITDLRENTYYAVMHLERDEQIFVIDARPSDAIALALLSKIQLFVTKDVMKVAAQPNPFRGTDMKSFPSFGKGPSGGQRKIEFSKTDFDRISDMLKKARAREQASE